VKDEELVYFTFAVIALCGLSILHSWMIGRILDHASDLRADVDWLKDNTVANDAGARA
jgi:hypothetical protein